MPRNVRNFWIELEVDGKKQRIATGPVSAQGGFRMTIKQRDKGSVVNGMTVEGRVQDGTVALTAHSAHASISHTTER